MHEESIKVNQKIDFPEPAGLNDVSEFHQTFEMPVLETPTIPDKKRCALRINLLEEELNELKKAIEDNDLIEVADALCDLQYVLSGAILEFGLGPYFKELFDEVQRSNMSKVCHSSEEAKDTQAYYQKRDGTQSLVESRDGQYLVYRIPDRKVLKSVNYSPADLQKIIEKYTAEK